MNINTLNMISGLLAVKQRYKHRTMGHEIVVLEYLYLTKVVPIPVYFLVPSLQNEQRQNVEQ